MRVLLLDSLAIVSAMLRTRPVGGQTPPERSVLARLERPGNVPVMSTSPPAEQEYAGQRLGLPAEGPGSVASWGRRVAALFVDWIGSLLVANAISSYAGFSPDTARLLPTLVFLAEVTVFTGLMGGSFGQLTLRVVVARLDGKPVNLLQALVRTLLILLVIPPVVFNRDNRGLHDLAVGTITLRR